MAAAVLTATGVIGSAGAAMAPNAGAAATASAGVQVPRCELETMRVTISDPQAESGVQDVALTLTDLRARTCTVDGYPRFGLLSPGGQREAAVTIDGPGMFHGDPGAHLVTLHEGESARDWVTWGDDGAFKAHNAGWLVIRLPGSKATRIAHFPSQVQVFRGYLTVTALALVPPAKHSVSVPDRS